jgi:hypothetical protein
MMCDNQFFDFELVKMATFITLRSPSSIFRSAKEAAPNDQTATSETKYSTTGFFPASMMNRPAAT